MNKTSINVKPILSSLLILSATMIVPASWADDNCVPYAAQLHLEGISPYGPLNGAGLYTIGDTPQQGAQVTAILKGSAVFDPTSPVVEIDFADMVIFAPNADGSPNVLTAIDKSVGTATGPGTFTATTKSRITGGIGLYEEVTGKARSTNTTTVDLMTGYTVSDISVEGTICGIGEAGNE